MNVRYEIQKQIYKERLIGLPKKFGLTYAEI
jgi:hypothetical protein